jgi:hypothetical protein
MLPATSWYNKITAKACGILERKTTTTDTSWLHEKWKVGNEVHHIKMATVQAETRMERKGK